jgi:hypothetical protein
MRDNLLFNQLDTSKYLANGEANFINQLASIDI